MSSSKSIRNGFSIIELALISVLSSVWIVSQLYLESVIGQIIHIHGVIQRMTGWFLMIVLVKPTGKFGRVTAMATLTSLDTGLSALDKYILHSLDLDTRLEV